MKEKLYREKILGCVIALYLFIIVPGFASSEVGPDGSFNYSIPIEVPPATAGIGPELALKYNSESDNGIVGVGWDLSGYDIISRDPRYPIYYVDPPSTNEDHYMYMGQRLIKDPANNGIYHTENETYLKIEFITSSTSGFRNYWTVTDKNGVTRYYGSRYSDAYEYYGGFVPLRSPDGSGRTLPLTTARLWALDRVQDLNGNYYTIDYDQPSYGRGWYPRKIVYTKNDNSGKAYNRYRAVVFDYATTTRAEAIATPNYGRALLTKISVYTNVLLASNKSISSGTLHHSYILKYQNDGEEGRNCDKSVLQSFQEWDSTEQINKPPLTFSYTPNHNVLVDNHELDEFDVGDVILTTADFNGDGKDDLATYSRYYPHSVIIYYSNPSDASENGGFPKETRRIITDGAWRDQSSDKLGNVIIFGDFNGDGRQDFMLYEGHFGGSTIQQWWRLYLAGPEGFGSDGIRVDFGDTSDSKTDGTYFDLNKFRVGDFNGDGKSDIISLSTWSGEENFASMWRVFLAASDGTGFTLSSTGQAVSVPFNPYNDHYGQKCYSYDPDYFAMGDFNGDGNNDFIVYTNLYTYPLTTYAWVLYIADGVGSFTREPVTADFGKLSYLFGSHPQVYFYDFNGDGCTDVLSQTSGFVSVASRTTIDNDGGVFTMFYSHPNLKKSATNSYFLSPANNPAGNTFPTPLSYRLDPSQFGDFNGDGLTDFIIGCLGTRTGVSWYDEFTFKTYFGTGFDGVPFQVGASTQNFSNFGLNTDFDTDDEGSLEGALIPGDFDGNGSTDYMFRVGQTTSCVYGIKTSKGDGTFASSCSIDIKPYFTYNVPPFRIAAYGNYSGSGRIEFIAMNDSKNCKLFSHYNIPRANLLNSITNGVGGVTSILYFPAPSYLVPLDGNPDAPVDPSLIVVNSAVCDTSIRNLVDTVTIHCGKEIWTSESDVIGYTQYKYFGGMCFPGPRPERCALGFNYIEALDMQTGSKTKTYYSQNKSEHTQGAILVVETYDAVGKLATKAETMFGSRKDNPSLPVFFVYKTSDSFTTIEGSLTTGMELTYKTEYEEYDDYGNATHIINRGNPNTTWDDTETRIEFAVNVKNHLMKIYKQETLGWDNGNPRALAIATQTIKYFDNLNNPGKIEDTGKGLVTKIVSTAGGSEPDVINTIEYDNWGNPSVITDGRGIATQKFYDTNYHMLTIRTIGASPMNFTTDFTYDNYMNLTSEKDTSNDVVKCTTLYDSFNNPWKVMGPNDSLLDPLIEYTYDYGTAVMNSWGRISEPKWFKTSTKPAQGSTRIQTITYYDGVGNVIQKKTSLPEGVGTWKTVTCENDTSGRLWIVTEPYNQTVPEYYVGNRGFAQTEYFYDNKGRPCKVKYPDGTTTERVYGPATTGFIDKDGNYTETKVEGNVQTALEYWSVPTVSGSHPIGNGTITTEYRGGTKVTDNNGNTTTTVINMLGRRTSITSPDMGTWTFKYDGDGNIVSQTDANSNEIKYEYDNCNRLVKIDYPDSSTTDTTFVYDEMGHGYAKGRLTTATYAAGNISYTYDNMGRITTQTVTIDSESRTESYEYYPTGMLYRKTLPDGEVLTYTYNSDGTIASVRNDQGYYYVLSASYNILGQVKNMVRGNFKTTQYDYYDSDNSLYYVNHLLRHERTELADGKLFEYDYTYTPSGRLSHKNNTTDDRLSATYEYDQLGRLTWAGAIPPIGPSSYMYDNVGNITNKTGHNFRYDSANSQIIVGDDDFSYFYTYYPGTNRLKSDGRYYYTYDNNGNIIAKSSYENYIQPVAMTSTGKKFSSLQAAYEAAASNSTVKATASDFIGDIKPTTSTPQGVTFSGGWDAGFTGNNGKTTALCGQITSADKTLSFSNFVLSSSGPVPGSGGGPVGTGPAVYAYDYNNMLIAANGVTFAYFGESRVRKTENGVTTRYFFGDYQEETGAPDVSKNIVKHYPGSAMYSTGDGLLYIYKDITGNPAMITDINDIVVNTIMYDPFGSIVFEDGSKEIKYKFAGGERDTTGLQCFGARYYDPAVGRFITPDILVPGGSTQCFNRYAYCVNNPVNLVDPSGHEGEKTDSMAGGLWVIDALDFAYTYSGARYMFDVTDAITKPLLKVCSVPLNMIGVERIHFGIWYGIGGEIDINCETGDYSANVGSGSGIQGGFSTRYADIGGACETHVGLGYNSADKSVYFKASAKTSTTANFSGGMSVTIGYSFKNHAGYQNTTMNAGPMQFGWSTYGTQSSMSYSLSFAGLSLSWSNRTGFGLGTSLSLGGGNSAGISYNVNNGKWRGSVNIAMCFVAGTKVETVDGEKNIEDIKAGDLVRSFNPDTGEFGYKQVVTTIVTHPDEIVKVRVGDETLECTKVHPFFVISDSIQGKKQGIWINAGELKPGMKLLCADDSIRSIEEITIVSRNETTYNFEVADWHTYCVGKYSVVVHNEEYGCPAGAEGCSGGRYYGKKRGFDPYEFVGKVALAAILIETGITAVTSSAEIADVVYVGRMSTLEGVESTLGSAKVAAEDYSVFVNICEAAESGFIGQSMVATSEIGAYTVMELGVHAAAVASKPAVATALMCIDE